MNLSCFQVILLVVYIIRMNLQEEVFGSVDWIELAQDRDRWRALVNAVMNLWFP